MGVCPWSPLASGFLTGKYTRGAAGAEGDGRLEALQKSGHPVIKNLFTDKNWRILDALVGVAKELGKTPAEVALAWTVRRPGVSSMLIGATKMEQLEANLRALSLRIPPELAARLEAVSRPEPAHPYNFFEPDMQGGITGGTVVRSEPAWFRGGPTSS